MKYLFSFTFIALAALAFLFVRNESGPDSMRLNDAGSFAAADTFPVQKSDEEWKEILTPEEFKILRLAGTERPYNNEYEKHFESGMYVCAACGNKLFASDTKYESFCGWPSFWDTLDSNAVATREDNRYGMKRTEIICANCGGHLGHVFNDGPPPTGLRYCLNSVAMNFIPADSLK